MRKSTLFNKFIGVFLTLVFISPDALALTRTIINPVSFTQSSAAKLSDFLASLPLGWKDDHTAYLGVSKDDALGKPGDDVFEFYFGEAELAAKSFNLEYSVLGVSNAQATPVVVNGQNSYGTTLHKSKKTWQRGSMTILSDQLKVGRNTVLFTLPEGIDQVSVKQVSLTPNTEMGMPSSPMVLREAQSHDFSAEFSSSYYQKLHLEAAQKLDPLPAFALEKSQVASIPASFTNITRGAVAYRVLGERDSATHVSIGIDPSVGYNRLREVKVFYFDYERKDWAQAHVSRVNHASYTLEADGEGGTDYFAALIKTPDMPEAAAFMPTSISDLEPANPATGVNLIQPPTANQQGDANISYPIAIPPGRQGMQPQVSLNYSSSAGSGWAGYGWSVPVQSISVDTRFGVPTFDPTTQTEVYIFNGESLHGESGDKANRPRIVNNAPSYPARKTGTQQFFTKQRSGYQKIERIGNTTSAYCWVVTDANGTKSYYGTLDGSTVDSNSVQEATFGNHITTWYLRKVEDRFNNSILYTYESKSKGNTGDLTAYGQIKYLKTIQYTGTGNTPGAYSVNFVVDDSGRTDTRVSLNSGYKQLDYLLLEKIVIKYNTTEIKHYRLGYNQGDFSKTRLDTITEVHGNTDYYSHIFEYETNDKIAFEATPVVIPFNKGEGAFSLKELPQTESRRQLATAIRPSMVKTTRTLGYNVGGAAGFGVTALPFDIFPDKSYAINGNLGMSQSSSFDQYQLQDVNGDGLSDMIKSNWNNSNYTYRPMQVDANGNVSFGAERAITADGLYKNKSTSINAGVSFIAPGGIYSFGANTNISSSVSKRYLLDYNGDGILDRTRSTLGGSIVEFGILDKDGTLRFENHSGNTLNPVIKNTDPAIEVPAPEQKKFEVVKTWIAPVEGTVDIQSAPQMNLGVMGDMIVSIQKNSGFLQPPTPMPVSSGDFNGSTSVQKGDILTFRLSPESSGQEDFITWNPSVTYLSTINADGNGSNYTHSTYDDQFVVNGAQGVQFESTDEIKVTLNRTGAFDYSDDIYYRINVEERDELGNAVSTQSFVNRLDQSATQFSPFSEPFIGNYATLSSNAGNYMTMTFELFAHSNIDWGDIDYRPKVEIKTDCSLEPIEFFPTVGYGYYNRVDQLEGPVSFTVPAGDYEILPEISESKAQIGQVFGNITGADIDQTIYFAVKSGGKYISKKALILHLDSASKNNNSYTLKTISQPTGLPWNTTNAYTYTGTATGTFDASEIVNGSVTLEFFAQNSPFAQAALNYVRQNLVGFNVVNSANFMVTQLPSQSKQNYFYGTHDPFGTMQLGWGQFAWSADDQSPIPTKEMEEATSRDAKQRSEPVKEGELDTANTAHLDPWQASFFTMMPVRGENAVGLRSYQEAVLSTEPSKDHYAVSGSYIGLYRSGKSAPGFIGELEEETVTEPLPTSLYMAYSAPRVNVSKTLNLSATAANSTGIRSLSANQAVVLPGVFFSNATCSFQDMNGDGYPDAIVQGLSGAHIYYTNSSGGHLDKKSGVLAGRVSKSISVSGGITATQNFPNEDKRFIKQGSGKLGLGANYGYSYQRTEFMDLNGDGLQDRVYNNGDVELNAGTAFFAKVSTTLPGNESVNKTTNQAPTLTTPLKNALNNSSFKVELLGKSYNAGLGVNNSGSFSNSLGMDLNGDGLTDIVKYDAGSQQWHVHVNTGTSFVLHEDASSTTVDLGLSAQMNQSQNFGLNLTAGATIGFPAFAFIKGDVNINGGINMAINKMRSSFMDINGDGAVDFVDVQENGDMHVYYNKTVRSNYLTKVHNPLGGSFEVKYAFEGHKRGVRDAQVLTHRSLEKMLWDMPSGKWVLSEVIIHDGVDMTGEYSSNVDLDGVDEMHVYFEYDGGIQNRREKAFAGFTRVQTRQQNQAGSQTATTQKFLTEVIEYFAPDDLTFDAIKAFDYKKGLVRNTYAFYHDNSTGSNVVSMISQQNSNYEFRTVLISGANKGQVKESSPGVWEQVNWSSIDEQSTVFPAVTKSEALNYPQIATNAHYHSQEFELFYDKYFNVVRYQDKAEMTAGTPSETTVETIYYTQVHEHATTVTCSDLDNMTPVYDDDVLLGYEVMPSTALQSQGFVNPDTVWVVDDGSSCGYSNPFDSTTCETHPNTTFEVVFTHETPETTYVKKTVSNAAYTSDRIAVMTYFTPTQAAGRTSVLNKHSIYNGTITASKLVRESEVTALKSSGKSVGTLRTKLNSSQYAEYEMFYDAYGNVTRIIGPANHANQRTQMDFTYDATLHQYTTGVANQFGESTCNLYDLATGQLLQTVGINGHAMRYEYDQFDRLKSVWAPRELNISGSAPTISYAYQLYDHQTGEPARAITTHNLGNTDNPAILNTQRSCATLLDLAGRPAISSGVRTATFVDGNAKAVQLQTEQSTTSNGINGSSFMISGPESVDKFGRTSQVYADFSSIGSISGVGSFGTFAGVVNLSTVDLMQKDVLYDYNNRVTSSDSWTAEKGSTAGQWITTVMKYDWNTDLIPGKTLYYEKTEVQSNATGLTNATPNIENATYTDSRGRKVGTITYGSTSSDSIVTVFNYNNIGELTEVVDPLGLSTFYAYDLAGRVTTEYHPDRGMTVTTYDPASNVTQIQTPGSLAFGGSVTMEYDYNRLVHKYMPLSSGADLYDIAYTYGTKGDGRNGAGRITQVIQGQGFKTDLLRYDELGNVVDENTTIDVPLYGYKSFTTTKSYDSFGRIIQANYPDGDKVDYSYTSLGELFSIESTLSGVSQMIVSGILYNGYGQISKLSYGNGTYTDYDYNVSGSGASTLKKNTLFKTTTKAKEQGATSQSTVLERNYTYNTQGMVTQLDRDVAGTLMNSSAGTMVPLSEKYSYDTYGRFDTHQHKIGGNTEYTLEMTYNKAGGILQKDAQASGIMNAPDLNYTLNYNYSTNNPHQLEDVIDANTGAQSYYQYNSSGSIKEIQDPTAGGPQNFFWNEEQWLSGVSNDLGVHHYVYDHKGERVIKSSVMHSSVQINDQNIDDIEYLEPYTLYINPYYVVTELKGGDKVSKHYYMNTQRVATDISINYQVHEPMAGPQQPNARDPKKPSEDTTSVNYNAAFADLQTTLTALGHQKLDVDGLGDQPTLEEYYPELVSKPSQNSTMAAKNAPESTTRVMFWYHPDYLGNVDLVTERDGKTYEFFTYNPWGEEMHQYNANTFSFSSPYRFNSKEKDAETGLHYYGARYYQSKLSVWMSVDPLSHLSPNQTPHHFVSNNPIMRIDPMGLTDFTLNKKTGEVTQVGEANDEPDRILQTNRKGEVKFNKNGEAKVAIKGIEKGILADGQNWKTDDQIIEVGGEGQPTVDGVHSFTLGLSEYIGREISGYSYSSDGSGKITDVLLGHYKDNTRTKSYCSPVAFTKKYRGRFSFANFQEAFHTHPDGLLGATQSAPELSEDVKNLQKDKPSVPNAQYFILYRIPGQSKPGKYDYTHEYRSSK